MIYTSSSQSLAALETLVHTDDPADLTALRYVTIPVQIPEKQILIPKTLPRNWSAYPAPVTTAKVGNQWIASRESLALRVPSAVIKDEFNYLLNPAHPDFSKLVIGNSKAFKFDQRFT